MTEADFIHTIREGWSVEGRVTEALLLEAVEATRRYPESAQLWRLRGDLLRIVGPEQDPSDLGPLQCYEMAVTLAPHHAEIHQAIGDYYDACLGDLCAAERAFRMALDRGGSGATFTGLARVLAERGKKREALVLLSRERCPVASDSDVCSMREQIECGRFDRPWDSDSGVGY
ncbi:MAG: hypothetical protein V3R77_05340 [Candidatus Binatia bacterium]